MTHQNKIFLTLCLLQVTSCMHASLTPVNNSSNKSPKSLTSIGTPRTGTPSRQSPHKLDNPAKPEDRQPTSDQHPATTPLRRHISFSNDSTDAEANPNQAEPSMQDLTERLQELQQVKLDIDDPSTTIGASFASFVSAKKTATRQRLEHDIKKTAILIAITRLQAERATQTAAIQRQATPPSRSHSPTERQSLTHDTFDQQTSGSTTPPAPANSTDVSARQPQEETQQEPQSVARSWRDVFGFLGRSNAAAPVAPTVEQPAPRHVTTPENPEELKRALIPVVENTADTQLTSRPPTPPTAEGRTATPITAEQQRSITSTVETQEEPLPNTEPTTLPAAANKTPSPKTRSITPLAAEIQPAPVQAATEETQENPPLISRPPTPHSRTDSSVEEQAQKLAFTQADLDNARNAEKANKIFYQRTTILATMAAIWNTKVFAQYVLEPGMNIVGKGMQALGRKLQAIEGK